MENLLDGSLTSNTHTHLFITCVLFLFFIAGYHMMVSLCTHNKRICIYSRKDHDTYALDHPENLNNQILSSTHSIISFFSSVYLIYKYDYRPGTLNNHFEDILMCFSFSYMIYDTIYESFYGQISMILHHIFSILTLGFCLYTNKFASDICLAMIASEGSTPFLHLRSCVKHYLKSLDTLVKIDKSQFGHQPIDYDSVEYSKLLNCLKLTKFFSEKIFSINFLLGRLVLGPLATFLTFSSKRSHFIIKFGALSIQLISLYWACKLIRKIMRRT